jgi:hypothetical protein
MELAMRTLPRGVVEVSELHVDPAVEACGGDLRETVRALLAGQLHMGIQMLKLRGKTSTGYTRQLPVARINAASRK